MAHGLSRDEATALLQRLHDVQGRVYAGGDPAELATVLTADVTWHVPGDNEIAGTYRGIQEVTAYMLRRRELADRTFTMHPRELLVGIDHIASITDGEVRRAGLLETWGTVGLYKVRAGKIAECRLLPFDPGTFDRIWGRT
jgi:ketosteroid isomerase-like protein